MLNDAYVWGHVDGFLQPTHSDGAAHTVQLGFGQIKLLLKAGTGR